MRKAIILYKTYFEYNKPQRSMGGVQTYLLSLFKVLRECDFEPEIIVYMDKFGEYIDPDSGVKVHALTWNKRDRYRKIMLKKAYEIADTENDLLIFGTADLGLPHRFKHSISIQHGIYWDINDHKNYIYSTIRNIYKPIIETKRLMYVNQTVCVDYNYINWLKACTHGVDYPYYVIPNFSKLIPLKEKVKSDQIKVIFARRFNPMRGSKIICPVMRKILLEFPNVELTMAIDFENVGNNLFDGLNVKYTRFHPEESVKVQQDYDIALIPSIGSEGTSFSLIEAWAAKCCVVAGDAGGITNMLIDGYNGIMVSPVTEENLYRQIKRAILDEELRKRVSENGYQTAAQGLDFETWKSKWKYVIESVMNQSLA